MKTSPVAWTSIIAIFDQKYFISAVIFSQFLVIQTLDLDLDQYPY
jgi:hypothetical protein